MSSGISSGVSSVGGGAGSSTSTRSPALSLCGGFAARPPAAQEEEDEAGGDDEEADELRGREPGQAGQARDVPARVVADELDEEARDTIEHGVGGDDLAREALATVQAEQQEEDEGAGRRLVELRR